MSPPFYKRESNVWQTSDKVRDWRITDRWLGTGTAHFTNKTSLFLDPFFIIKLKETQVFLSVSLSAPSRISSKIIYIVNF